MRNSQLAGLSGKGRKRRPPIQELNHAQHVLCILYGRLRQATQQEEYFWKTFASGDGVRLRIEVRASNPNFRKVRYEQRRGVPIPVLAELTRCIRETYGRQFILKGISRLCSFYLSGRDYGIENEYRALYRVWEGFGPQPKGDPASSYIELPLNTMSECGYQLTVTEVQAHTPIKSKHSAKYVGAGRGRRGLGVGADQLITLLRRAELAGSA